MLGTTAKVIQYLAVTPAVIQLVLVLVQMFETEGNGEAKKKAVLDTIEAVYKQVAGVVNMKVSLDFVKRVAEQTIDISVNFFNLVGLFKNDSQQSAEK